MKPFQITKFMLDKKNAEKTVKQYSFSLDTNTTLPF